MVFRRRRNDFEPSGAAGHNHSYLLSSHSYLSAERRKNTVNHLNNIAKAKAVNLEHGKVGL